MVKVKEVMGRIFGKVSKRHPDIWKQISEYADARGLKPEDVVAGAATVYMMSDASDEEKSKLEGIIASRSGGGGRAQNPMQSFKATAGALEEVKKLGSEGGKGTLVDTLADAFVQNIFSQIGAKGGVAKILSQRKTLGTGKVEKGPDDVVA